jgi:phage terminase Nu1 subunit (DNA packaging protein)
MPLSVITGGRSGEEGDVTEGPRVRAEELAAYLGITVRSISEHARQGHVKKIGRAHFDLQESVRRYCQHLRAAAAGRQSREGDVSSTQARARKELAQAVLAEARAEIIRKEVVSVDQVLDGWMRVVKSARSTLLGLHTRIAVHLGLTVEQAQGVRVMVRQALAEIAEAGAKIEMTAHDAADDEIGDDGDD